MPQATRSRANQSMYIPSAFQETDRDRLFEFIETHSFGLLISAGQQPLFTTHLPFLFEPHSGPHGCLVGHMARANPHWREVADRPALAIFSGAHTYISPTWYRTENVVPTWNYVAVHACGKCTLVEDEQGITRILQDTVEKYERSMPAPWTIASESPFFKRLAKMVVGIRLEIECLEGKWKLGQNHPPDLRRNVASMLAGHASDDAREIARLMTATLE
jgi:transcriptional regulator